MIALAVGTLLALAALVVVLYPLFVGAPPPRPASADADPESSPGEMALAALREIEFDRATGKLSEADYAALRATYTARAVAAMRAEEPSQGSAADEVEAAILRYRRPRPSCLACGPRPEAGALYCSSCGRYLAGACARCGAPVTEPAARYCTGCGSSLAA